MTTTIDIFISYKREERALAMDVGRVLQEAGYTTVTDLNIQKSKDFGEAIDKMIREARLVVVLWTPASAASEWVRLEAHEADAQGKYFGVVLKPLAREDLPLELRRKQYLDLGNRAARDLSRIPVDVRELIGEGSFEADVASAESDALNDDFYLFQIVDRLGDAEGFRAYLTDYPNGLFATPAKARLAELSTSRDTERDTLSAENQRLKRLLAERDKPASTRDAWTSRQSLMRIYAAFVIGAGVAAYVTYVWTSAQLDRVVTVDLPQLQEAATETATNEASGSTNRLGYDQLTDVYKCKTRPYTNVFWDREGRLWGAVGFAEPPEEISDDSVEPQDGVRLGKVGCISLTTTDLDLFDAPVDNIAPLNFLPDLRSLNLSSTLVDDLGGLEGMSALVHLDLSYTPVQDLEPLKSTPQLKTLDLRGPAARQLGDLKSLTNLHWLALGSGQILGEQIIDSPTTRKEVADYLAAYQQP